MDAVLGGFPKEGPNKIFENKKIGLVCIYYLNIFINRK